MARKLAKNHKILCTSRNYREVVQLSKIKHMNLQFVGRHGGSGKKEKLRASIQRIDKLIDIVSKFSPDLVISFCSPEATRVSFGLGIKHIAFSDSPHAEAVMRLCLPFIQKLLIPWVVPKKDFVKYGITADNIIQYKAIDAAVIVKDKTYPIPIRLDRKKKVVIIRVEESSAAYALKNSNPSYSIIERFAKEGKDYNIIVLPRYKSQIIKLKNKFGDKVRIMTNVVDGKSLLLLTDLFIGTGGTMTGESALMGIPTISFSAFPNHIERYLVKTGLLKKETNPRKLVALAKKMLHTRAANKGRAYKILNSMEDPFEKLAATIKTI